MTEIITDLAELAQPSEQLKFLTTTGIDKKEGDKIIKKLKATLDTHKGLLAISAPQIGIKKRVLALRFNDSIKILINPIITKKNNIKIAPETCISMPDKEILIARPQELVVVYCNEDYQEESNKFLDLAARIIDQMVQFFDGVTPADLGLVSVPKVNGSLYDLTEDELTECSEIYAKFIKNKCAAMEKDLSTDAALDKEYRKQKFYERVINNKAAIFETPKEAPSMNRAKRRALKKQKSKKSKEGK